MERFEDYYGGTPNIKTVVFKIVPDSDARALQLMTGEIDMAQVTAKTAEGLEEKKELSLYHMETADYRAIAYNFSSPLFFPAPGAGEYSQLCHRSGSHSEDRFLLGEGEAAYSPLQKSEYVNTEMEKFTYDPDKTQELLKAAGWKKGGGWCLGKGWRSSVFCHFRHV